jgi:cell division septum initiation protein DivIVA
MKDSSLFQEQTSAYAKKIGVMLWWTVPKCSITRADLLRSANRWNIPDKYVPNEISFVSSFNRAISSVKTTLDNKDSVLLREIKTRKIAIVKESVNSDRTNHQQLGIVECDPVKRNISLTSQCTSATDTDLLDRVGEKIGDAIQEAKKYGADDIRAVLTGFCKDAAISLRESGGIYFVSVAHEQTLNNLSSFVRELCPDAVIYCKPEYIVQQSDLAPLQAVGESELTKEIAALESAAVSLQSELANLTARDLSGKKSRQGKFINVMQDYVDAKRRVEVFSQTLDLKTGGLLGKLKSLHGDLQKQMDQLSIAVDHNISTAFEQMLDEIDQPQQPPRPSLPPPLPTPPPLLTPQVGIKVEKNAEKDGIEIFFQDKPDDAVRDRMKLNGFKFGNHKKCWYAKYTDERWQFATSLGVASVPTVPAIPVMPPQQSQVAKQAADALNRLSQLLEEI